MSTAFCFDLDGTLTRSELLPMIARHTGYHEEISALTQATLEGVIPFESSFRLRCKLLQDVDVRLVQSAVSQVCLFEKILEFIKHNNKKCFVITGNLNVWIDPLIKAVGCDFFCSQADVKAGKLVGINSILDKGACIEGLRQEFKKIVAIGDGMGDVRMFEKADYSIAFGGTHTPVRSLVELSDYVTFSEDALCRILNML